AALLTGDIWFTRVGAVIAFAGGLVSSLFAWREVRRQRGQFLAQSAAELHAHGQKLHAERSQHMRLLQVLQARNSDLRGRLVAARAEAAQLGSEVATLRGDNASLKLDVTELRADKNVLQAEVARLTEVQTAEILGLPRRSAGSVSTQEEVLWTEENLPTVVDLKAITAPFSDSAPAADSELRAQA
ncbi:MAG: hypothetical protein VB093_19115, partial [Propionicimonas sp.]|nr:hypothetical protein [Propionicimonas sp.]